MPPEVPASASGGPGLAVRWPLSLVVLLVVAGGCFLADMATKAWALAHATPPRPFLPGLISLTLTTNTGAVFGMFRGSAPVLSAISFLIMAALVVFWWWEGRNNLLLSVSVGILLGGAGGNLYDRLRQGAVVDFLHFDFLPWWPAFNVADVATVIGVTLLIGWMAAQRGQRGAS
ncbi:MAG: signal peptidase II [Armatimonadetes bacterium]|nr:signal peptidase II [Armatimonadota bacterium]